MPVLWTAARHTLVTAALALAAFYLHVAGDRSVGARPCPRAARVRRGSPRRRDRARHAGVAGGVGSSRPTAAHPGAGASAVPLSPDCGVLFTFYAAAGYGAHGSGGYATLAATAATLTFALRHWLILLAELAAATPSDPAGAATDAMQWVAAAWGAVTVGLLWMMVRIIRPWLDPRDMSALRWMTLAAAARPHRERWRRSAAAC